MKQLYSLILLFSFVIGILQPVMPMIEYHIQEGDLGSLIFNQKMLDELNCNPEESLADYQNLCECERNCSEESNKELLDLEFYPVPVNIAAGPALAVLPPLSEHYNNLTENLRLQYLNVNSPPPRIIWIPSDFV